MNVRNAIIKNIAEGKMSLIGNAQFVDIVKVPLPVHCFTD